MRRPTLSQERKRKRKSACCVRNDSVGGVARRERAQRCCAPTKDIAHRPVPPDLAWSFRANIMPPTRSALVPTGPEAAVNKTLKIVLIVVAVLVVVVLVAPFLIPVNQFRPIIEEKASAALGRKVQLGNISLSLISGSLSAENLSIGDDPKFSSAPFLTAKSLDVGVEVMPLILSKTLNVTGVTIATPKVPCLHKGGGQWNYSSLGGAAAKAEAKKAPAEKPSPAAGAAEVSIQKLTLSDGSIIVGSTNSQKRSTYDHVNVTASDVSLTPKFPVTVTADLPAGGKLKLDGTFGPVDQADTALTPLNAKLNVTGLNLASTGFLDPSMGLGGIVDLDASLSSKGASLAAGALNTNLNITGPTNKLITTGTVGLYNAKLAGFDLGSRMSTISALTGLKTGQDLDIEKITTNLHMAPTGLEAENFLAAIPALGTLVGSGTLDSKNNLDFKMAATLANTATYASSGGAPASGIGGILGAIGGGKGGCKGATIPFQIHGTTADPKFVPDIEGTAASLLQSQLGCAGGTAPGAKTNLQQQTQNPADAINALGELFKKKKP